MRRRGIMGRMEMVMVVRVVIRRRIRQVIDPHVEENEVRHEIDEGVLHHDIVVHPHVVDEVRQDRNYVGEEVVVQRKSLLMENGHFHFRFG